MAKSDLTCIIVDDETDALEGLEILINAIGSVEILEKISASETATEKIIELKPDIVFLDIDMPIKNGFEILDDINELKINTKVVFVTAYNQYVLKALRNSAFDYLTKPVDRIELKEVINRISNCENTANISLNTLNMIKIPVNYGSLFLRIEDIIYLEADGNYTQIYTNEGKEFSSLNLGKFELKLSTENFIKISKSLIINTLYLSRFDRKNKKCVLKNGDNCYELTVSRRNLNIFDNLL